MPIARESTFGAGAAASGVSVMGVGRLSRTAQYCTVPCKYEGTGGRGSFLDASALRGA